MAHGFDAVPMTGPTKGLEELIADTQSCIQALDRRLCNLEEASRVARTVEENPLADAAPILAAPRVSYRAYLRDFMKRRQRS